MRVPARLGLGIAILGALWQLASILSTAEWIATRAQNPGWIGSALSSTIGWLVSAPSYYSLGLCALGIALATTPRWWAATAKDRTKTPRLVLPISIESIGKLPAIGDLTPLSALRITNPNSPLYDALVHAERVMEERWVDSSNSFSTLVKGIPDPFVLKTDGQWRDPKGRGGGVKLRRNQPKNVPLLWEGHDGKRFFRDEAGNRYFPSEEWVEMIVAIYGHDGPTKKRVRINVRDAAASTSVLPLIR